MMTLSALLDSVLTELRDSRLAAPPRGHATLAPVWAMPMVKDGENQPPPAMHAADDRHSAILGG